MNDASKKDPIIEAARFIDAPFNNSGYRKGTPMRVAGGNVYTVYFTGEDNKPYEHYVFERGDRCQAYFSLGDLVADPLNGIATRWTDLERLRLMIIASLTILLTLACIFIAIVFPDKTANLQALIGLLGAGFGWLVGAKSTIGATAH